MASSRPVQAGDHVFLVDGSSFIFRAYFQSMNQDQKYNARSSDGMPTGAVRLFVSKLLQFMRDGAAGLKPTHLAIVLDKSEGSFRKELYEDYKGHRPDAPEDLKVQMPIMREAIRAFGLEPVELQRYEADDLIATYTQQAKARGADVLIISSDKDLMQLVGPTVCFYDFESGSKGKPGYRPERNLDEAAVTEKWEGIPPEKIGDVLALMGDTSDNVPGVPGIGLKTAAQLIKEYGDLETLLERAPEIKQPKRRETLINNADSARLSKKLVTLDCEAPVPVPLDDLRLPQPDPKTLIGFLKAMEFSTLMRRVAELYEADPAVIEPDQRLMPGGEAIRWERNGTGTGVTAPTDDAVPFFGKVDTAAGEVDPFAGLDLPETATLRKPVEGLGTPSQLAGKRATEASSTPFDVTAYETVTSLERLKEWVARAHERGFVAVDTETSDLDANRADLVGFSLALEAGKAAYVPLQHRDESDLFGGGLVKGQIPITDALDAIRPLLEDSSVLKIGQNLKYDWVVLKRHGIDVHPFDDTMLISYVLDAGKGSHGMDELSRRHLGHSPISFSDVAGTGRNKVTFDKVEISKATAYAAEDADVTLRLWQILKPRLVAERRATVYETLERPMVDTLARMEMRGIMVDRQILSRLSGDFAQTLARLEDEIHEMAGEKFALGSPKQIGDILFGKMGLPGAKKTPSGQWATPATLLDELAQAGHELPAKILEWRQLSKLKSTYTDTLQEHMHPETKRVHTSFSLAATTTGRLSSSDPNLQNIPIRTEAGRKIRKAFVAPEGHKIISADYSQIELRLLAHIADIPQLQDAFAEGIDIHAATASAMFGVPLDQMTGDLRRQAKTINFGIIYGISAFGLATRLGIPNQEASTFIKQYFERFPGIRTYIDETKRFCKDKGYVTTLFGRVCHYPQIKSSNPSERAGVERQAINAPIQGTAADIIRRAMVRMEDTLRAERLSARMLLQVHDELVFEAPDDEVEATLPVISRVMTEAPFPAVTLKVPLAVEARAAQNWDEAH
ncbi:DNA polymerase I [Microvirga tunisiensis]|uniref:DNA polymerase I n=1 Tax=Microvirga tunisiensis TaxID=2108360 RepID=A0A5N7MNN4_9HYPH|nr:DNA polymerase I [Microvirga tunisiensis]MPR12209.1 DNA polymerase I [Microvirga tunisiensis]MPR28651.1 DNA polymerase I [Microvirga tunisiensis]